MKASNSVRGLMLPYKTLTDCITVQADGDLSTDFFAWKAFRYCVSNMDPTHARQHQQRTLRESPHEALRCD